MRDPQFMARVQRVQEAASGRWLDILIGAGVPEAMLLRLNRPCPLCGGRDRFSFYRNKPDGRWFCRGCGYGDGLSLLQKWRSERFTDTLVYLERVLGLPEYKRLDTEPDPVQAAEAAAKKRRQDRIEAVWKEAQALSKVPPSDPVRLYLASRGLYCGSIGEDALQDSRLERRERRRISEFHEGARWGEEGRRLRRQRQELCGAGGRVCAGRQAAQGQSLP